VPCAKGYAARWNAGKKSIAVRETVEIGWSAASRRDRK
jgi:hypothetical protein